MDGVNQACDIYSCTLLLKQLFRIIIFKVPTAPLVQIYLLITSVVNSYFHRRPSPILSTRHARRIPPSLSSLVSPLLSLLSSIFSLLCPFSLSSLESFLFSHSFLLSSLSPLLSPSCLYLSAFLLLFTFVAFIFSYFAVSAPSFLLYFSLPLPSTEKKVGKATLHKRSCTRKIRQNASVQQR